MSSGDDMETYDDALEIVKLPYFSLISTEDKVSVYKVLCGNLVNLDYKDGKMSQKEYDAWLENILRLFNVPIDDYLYPQK